MAVFCVCVCQNELFHIAKWKPEIPGCHFVSDGCKVPQPELKSVPQLWYPETASEWHLFAFLCQGLVCLRVSHVVSSKFPCLRRSGCGRSLLGFHRGWCAVMAFLRTQERTKERLVLPRLLLTHPPALRRTEGVSLGGFGAVCFSSARVESHYSVRRGHSANESCAVSPVMHSAYRGRCEEYGLRNTLCSLPAVVKCPLIPCIFQ